MALIYGLAIRLRLFAYKKGILRSKSLPGFVVSVGNITAGGTGKTPAVSMLAEWGKMQNLGVAVLSRGYAGRYKEKVLEVSDGNDLKASPLQTGDEPFLLASKLQGIPVVISKKRYLAGLRAVESFGSRFFILDDGFQHLSLKRDFNLVLIDSRNPFGNRKLLPLGPLREPLEQLERADVFIITRHDPDSGGHNIAEELRKRFPEKPVFFSDHIPENIIFPFNKISYSSDYLNKKRIIAFAGIARPEYFMDSLKKIGADVVFSVQFRDHHIYSRKEVERLLYQRKNLDAEFIVTTEKDWVRIKDLVSDCSVMAYLKIRFGILSGEEKFFELLGKGI